MGNNVQGRVELIYADEAIRERFAEEWGEKSRWGMAVYQYLHIKDGFTIVAMLEGSPVGFLSVYWNTLPYPLLENVEAYIDVIETFEGHKRHGIGRNMIELAIQRAREHGAYQIRAWSSEDKAEAIPMWRALNFGLSPAKTYPGGQEVRGFYATKVL